MTEEEKKEIQKLLENSEPCLYLGAGFSYGAKRGDENIPLGKDLQKKILSEIKKLDYELESEIHNSDLKSICKELKNLDEDVYINTLINSFKGFTPAEFQYYITDYKWKSIFTVNIDDIVENVYLKRNKPLQIVFSNNLKEQLSEKKQKLFKLHGCINHKDNGFIFSTDEYNDFISNQQNFKLMSLIIAFESSDFFVVGTEINEPELDFFISLYKKNENSLLKFRIIFINPKPSISFQRTLQKNENFKLIRATAEEFFDYIHSTQESVNKVIYQQQSIFKRSNFYSYGMIMKEHFNRNEKLSHISNLYFGDEPDWEDLTYDFIINYSNIDKFTQGVLNSNKRINIFYGALYSGKSSCLKYVYKYLSNYNNSFCLYSLGDYISLNSLRRCVKEISDSYEKIYLFFDDIGEYYSLFNQVLEINQRIIIVGTANSNIHNRKKYSLLLNETFAYEISDKLISSDILSIRNKFIEKGLAGKFTNIPVEEWYKKIKLQEGIVAAIYSITNGSRFKNYYDDLFIRLKIKENKFYNILLVCSFCYLMDVPYVKQYMLTSLNYKFIQTGLEEISDYIKITSDGSIRVRTKFIAESVLANCSDKQLLIYLIKNICISISTLVSDRGRNYTKNVYEYLTKFKNLHNILKLSNEEIKYLYADLQEYYGTISYYWLQLGIVEQKNNNFNYALQHFNTAHSINVNSYGIKHAIARNYCKQAVDLSSITQAMETFNYGKGLFLNLIKTKEYIQSKSYSIHSLIYEIMEFHKKFNIKLDDGEKKLCFDLLNDSKKMDLSDDMMSSLQSSFISFLKKFNNFTENDYVQYEELLDY